MEPEEWRGEELAGETWVGFVESRDGQCRWKWGMLVTLTASRVVVSSFHRCGHLKRTGVEYPTTAKVNQMAAL